VAVLPRRFYARDAATVARDLLGKVLVRDLGGVRRRARITEAEAYVGSHDLASHSRHGMTARNRTMFGPPGHAYVYFVYGVHHCLNAVTGAEGDGEAVLLRAAQPLDGWDARMSGPGLLGRAFGVTRADDGLDLTKGPLRILDGPPPAAIDVTARIGVAYAGDWAHRPLRFLTTRADEPRNPRNPRKRVSGRSVDSVARRGVGGGRHRKVVASRRAC
jgi:DNA-3-methyladenine glycosylase